jgi:hypothetical protein
LLINLVSLRWDIAKVAFVDVVDILEDALKLFVPILDLSDTLGQLRNLLVLFKMRLLILVNLTF